MPPSCAAAVALYGSSLSQGNWGSRAETDVPEADLPEADVPGPGRPETEPVREPEPGMLEAELPGADLRGAELAGSERGLGAPAESDVPGEPDEEATGMTRSLL
jgi:hypothetical protein